MKKRMKTVLGTACTAAIAVSMCAGVIPAQAEETQGVFGNTALRPTSSLNYTGTSTDGESFDPSVLVLDSVTVYNTDAALPNDNNAVVFLTNDLGDILWPAATVSCVDGVPDISTVVACEYAVNEAGQPTQIVSSTGEITSIGYDDAGRLVSYSDGTDTETFTYDAAGSVQEAYANTTLAYDESGRIESCVHYDTGVLAYYFYDTLGYLRETASFTVSEGLETMTVYDYGDAASQLGDFALQYPDVTAAAEAVTAAGSSSTTSTTTTTTTDTTTAATDTTQQASAVDSGFLASLGDAENYYHSESEEGVAQIATDEEVQAAFEQTGGFTVQ